MLCPLLMIVLNFISIFKILILFFSDYFKKYINGEYHNLYVVERIQPHWPYCLSSNRKHNGHYTSNVRFITADASHPVIIRFKKTARFM